MNKKFLSVLLFGALTIASTSTFVSCKDYDDDINDLHQLIEKNAGAIEEQRAALEAEINSLKTQLEQTEGKLAAAIEAGDKAEMERAMAAEAVLQTNIDAANAALAQLQALVDTKVDKATYEAEVKKIYASIEAVKTDLGAALTRIEGLEKGLADEQTARLAVAADLELQKEALDKLAKRVDAIAADYLTSADKTELLNKINEVNAPLEAYKAVVTKEIQDACEKAVKDAEAYADTAVGAAKQEADEKLAAAKKELNDAIAAAKKAGEDADAAAKAAQKTADDALAAAGLAQQTADKKLAAQTFTDFLNNEFAGALADINNLNVLVNQRLRAIVFDPQLYYEGVEAIEASYIQLRKVHITPSEQYIEDIDEVYEDKDGNPFLYTPRVKAEYFLNPSTADMSGENIRVSVLSGDKEYVKDTRAAACGPNVYGWTAPKGTGKMVVELEMDAPKVKDVKDDEISVFAVQVNVGDTAIVSDFAAIHKSRIENLVLGVPADVKNYYNTEKDCGIENETEHYVRALEAVNSTQVAKVVWNSDIDLSKYVDIHYELRRPWYAETVKHMSEMDPAAFNMHYAYDLVDYKRGVNEKTGETVHLAQDPNNKAHFRPQLPKENGERESWEAGKQSRATIGREPLVRISLVTDEAKDTVAIGYIKLQIVDSDVEVREYAFNDNGALKVGCDGYDRRITWSEIETKIYSDLGISREEFERRYALVGADSYDGISHKFEATRFVKNDKGEFVSAKDVYTKWDEYEANVLGHVYRVEETDGGTHTSVLNFNIDGWWLFKYYNEKTEKPYDTWIAFELVDNNQKVIFVHLVLPELAKTTFPAGTVDNAGKNANVWHALNTTKAGSGAEEIHNNIAVPGEGKDQTLFTRNMLSAFQGNKISLLGRELSHMGNYVPADADWKHEFVFAAANNDTKVKGQSGAEYTVKVSDDSKQIVLKDKDGHVTDVIATISGENIVLGTNGQADDCSAAAKDILNYVDHADLAQAGAFNPVVEIKSALTCGEKFNVDNNMFRSRFLRPLTATPDNSRSVTDAADNVQAIGLINLVKFDDWRDKWDAGYYSYYGISKIEQTKDADITTNMGQADANTFVALKNVSNLVQIEVKPLIPAQVGKNYGEVTYKNNLGTVATFKVRVPLTITYTWGTLNTVAEITINGTQGNVKTR